MRETGELFEVLAADGSGERYPLEPVPQYGRAVDDERHFERRSWSTWNYRVSKQPTVFVDFAPMSDPADRPDRFTLTFGTDPQARMIDAVPVAPGDAAPGNAASDS